MSKQVNQTAATRRGNYTKSKSKLLSLALCSLVLAPTINSSLASAAGPRSKALDFYAILSPAVWQNKAQEYRDLWHSIHNESIPEIAAKLKRLIESETTDEKYQQLLDYLNEVQKDKSESESGKEEKATATKQSRRLTQEEISEFCKQFGATKLGKSMQACVTADYYMSIKRNIVDKIRDENPFVNEPHTIETKSGNYTLPADQFKHIIFGDYDSKLAFLTGGGHTTKAFEIMEGINKAKQTEHPDNLLKDVYKEKVIVNNSFFCKKDGKILFYDFAKPKRNSSKKKISNFNIVCLKTFFPESWTPEKILKAIEQVLSDGKEIGERTDKQTGKKINRIIVGRVDGTIIGVIVNCSDNTVVTAYPLNDNDYESELKVWVGGIANALQKPLKTLIRQFNGLMAPLNYLKEQSAKEQLAKLDEQIKALDEQIKAFDEQIKAFEKAFGKQPIGIQETLAAADGLKSQLDNLENQINTFKKELSELRKAEKIEKWSKNEKRRPPN